MKAYWYRDRETPGGTANAKHVIGNVGDMLTPIILRNLTGVEPEYVPHTERGKLIAVGSLCEFIQDDDDVWGAGLISPTVVPPKRSNVKVLAVRGRKTADLLRAAGYEIPDVYGDPACIMPQIYFPAVEKKYRVGYVPHYVEAKEWLCLFWDKGHLIHIMSDPYFFIRQILKCEAIITSSLHAFLLARAYGIPAQYLQLTDKIIGGYFKYEDAMTGDHNPDQLIKVFNKYYQIS